MIEKMMWGAANTEYGEYRELNGYDDPYLNVNVLWKIDHGISFGMINGYSHHVCYTLVGGVRIHLHTTWLNLFEFTEPPTQDEIETMKMLGYTWGNIE